MMMVKMIAMTTQRGLTRIFGQCVFPTIRNSQPLVFPKLSGYLRFPPELPRTRIRSSPTPGKLDVIHMWNRISTNDSRRITECMDHGDILSSLRCNAMALRITTTISNDAFIDKNRSPIDSISGLKIRQLTRSIFTTCSCPGDQYCLNVGTSLSDQSDDRRRLLRKSRTT